jgi:hypothetical protein
MKLIKLMAVRNNRFVGKIEKMPVKVMDHEAGIPEIDSCTAYVKKFFHELHLSSAD